MESRSSNKPKLAPLRNPPAVHLDIQGQKCEHENDDQVLGHELEMSMKNKNPKKLILPANYNSNFSADTIDHQTMEQDEAKAKVDNDDENR